jgi:hypothetical protein
MKTINLWVVLLLCLLLSACSSRYIAPFSSPEINTEEGQEGIRFFFQEVKLNGASKYSQNAQKQDLAFVQVKVLNRTADTIRLAESRLQAFVDYQAVEILAPAKVSKQLRQKKAKYFLYLLPGLFYTGNGIIYYPVLAPLGVYHYIRASKANKAFEKDFMGRSLLGQEVAPGGMAAGWVCVSSDQAISNLMMRYVE